MNYDEPVAFASYREQAHMAQIGIRTNKVAALGHVKTKGTKRLVKAAARDIVAGEDKDPVSDSFAEIIHPLTPEQRQEAILAQVTRSNKLLERYIDDPIAIQGASRSLTRKKLKRTKTKV